LTASGRGIGMQQFW